MATLYSPKIVTDGLTIAVDAGNPKSYPGSGTTWYDLSGNGNHLGLVNSPTFTSSFGGGLNFNGTNQCATSSNSSTLNMNNKSFTGEVWLSIPTTSGAERMIFEYNVWSTAGTYQIATIGGTTIRVNYPEANANRLDYSYSPLVTGVPVFVVGQFDTVNNQFSIFINGSRVSANSGVTQEIGSSTGQLNVMARNAASLFLPGNLYSLRIYNRALSDNEIMQNFVAAKGRFGL